ncbi:YqcI/YcgG family protein [Actinacidiphila glaucinigra]|uniref:YqcI/YcgG family protein n=1 Tax=Actinacidiphila glaucinigra TaxID=235986 RepID=UPI0036A1DD94
MLAGEAEFLVPARQATAVLRKLVGDRVTGDSVPVHPRRRAAALRADSRSIEHLVRAYSGGSGLTLRQRAALRGASLGTLLDRVGVGLDTLGAGNIPPVGFTGPIATGPDATDWSPVSGPEAESFERVMRGTQCVFARRSVIWTVPWCGPDIEEALPAWGQKLRGFAAAARREPVDGIVLTLPGEYGATVTDLASTTRRVLRGLAELDGSSRCDLRSPEREGWYFTFARERMFLVTTAPCYPPDHSRHGFGEPYTYLLFQPDRAFDRAVSPSGGGLISPAVRGRIRDLYENSGRPYDLSITLSPFEAHRFVKPLSLGEAPVRWWELGPADEGGRSTR